MKLAGLLLSFSVLHREQQVFLRHVLEAFLAALICFCPGPIMSRSVNGCLRPQMGNPSIPPPPQVAPGKNFLRKAQQKSESQNFPKLGGGLGLRTYGSDHRSAISWTGGESRKEEFSPSTSSGFKNPLPNVFKQFLDVSSDITQKCQFCEFSSIMVTFESKVKKFEFLQNVISIKPDFWQTANNSISLRRKC